MTARLALLAACLLAGPARAAEPPASVEKLNTRIANFSLADAAGKKHALHDAEGKKAVVVVFLSFECPVSNSYAATLKALHRDYAGKGVAFIGIDGSDDLDAKQIEAKAREFGLPFPVFKDAKSVAADALKAETSPEAFVLDHNFYLRYRGRIDNTWAARLRRNQQTSEHDLKDALDALLAGKDVKVPATRAVGCPLARDREAVKAGKVTYHRDVLPILQNHCQGCHRPGEVGPFSLMTYQQAVNWADDVKDYTASRRMPPWKPVEGVAFHDERKLSEQQIRTLAAWVAEGCPEGDPKDAPPARTFTAGWQLGKPDLVLTVPEEITVGPAGRDFFRCVVLPTNLDEDKYVVALEMRPGNPRVLHHTLNFIDRTGKARELEQKEKERVKKPDEQDAGPGYTVAMGVGFTPQGGLAGWAPGQMPRVLPEGTAYLLPRGADVVIQFHYHRTGRVEKDKTSIGLYFAKKPVKQKFEGMVIPGRFLFIPADDPKFPVRGGIEVMQDCTLHSVMPHMHMLGRSITVTVEPPDGKPFTLIAIKDWEYNWQETYFLKEPLAVRAGTKMRVEALYDNTAKNPSNPFSPPRAVIFGEQTDNEMCFVFLGATSDKPLRRGTAWKILEPARAGQEKKP
jgi:peroxiredoxin